MLLFILFCLYLERMNEIWIKWIILLPMVTSCQSDCTVIVGCHGWAYFLLGGDGTGATVGIKEPQPQLTKFCFLGLNNWFWSLENPCSSATLRWKCIVSKSRLIPGCILGCIQLIWVTPFCFHEMSWEILLYWPTQGKKLSWAKVHQRFKNTHRQYTNSSIVQSITK